VEEELTIAGCSILGESIVIAAVFSTTGKAAVAESGLVRVDISAFGCSIVVATVF
jgi:hypothetical protein